MPGEWIWVIVPICVLMIPIVGILTRHQQKMAEILNRGSADHNEITSLRRELADLKALVHQQTITLDNLAGTQRALNTPPPTPQIAERLKTEG